MKKLMNVSLIFVLLAGLVNAKPSLDKIDTAISGYVQALKSDNAGLRHSALYQLALIKSEYPEINFDYVDRQLEKMSKKDKFNLIRLHANLTRAYLQDSDLQAKVKVEKSDNPVDFFKNLSQEIESSYAESYVKEVVSSK